MDPRELEGFLAVAAQSSFTEGARELRITQPGLSRQIQKLERELGASLFTRSRNGVTLTPAGQRFRTYAEDVIARYMELMEDLRTDAASLGGELRIAASTTPAEFLVPTLIAEFKAVYPEAEAIVYTSDSRQVIEDVYQGNRDLGLVGAVIPRPGLRFDRVASDEIVLAVPVHHPFSRLVEVPVEALAGQRFVRREDGSGTILSVRQALARQGLALPTFSVAMTLSTVQAVVSAVRSGYGIGFVSSLALGDVGARGPLAVRLTGIELKRDICLVRSARRRLRPVAQRFVDLVLQRTEAAPSITTNGDPPS